MVVGTSDGLIHLSIYDSFVIGDFRYVPTSPSGTSSTNNELWLTKHASHPDVSTHCLLLRPIESTDKSLAYLVPMDLSFIPSSPINISLLASKLTTLQKLLRYIKQTQLHMQVEWKNTRELPGRFLRGVQEDLSQAETGPTDIVQALFHTVVTGHTYEVVREWLVDNLAERVCADFL
jgi:anaphase-promoting complex subunit 4